MGPQGIIDLCDKLIYENNGDWIVFNNLFLKLIKENDYDTFVFMYIIWLNKYIEKRLKEIGIEKDYVHLDENMKTSDMAEMMGSIREWQLSLREEINAKVEKDNASIIKLFVDNRKKTPIGFKECIDIIGRSFSISSTTYDEKFERDWDVFSTVK